MTLGPETEASRPISSNSAPSCARCKFASVGRRQPARGWRRRLEALAPVVVPSVAAGNEPGPEFGAAPDLRRSSVTNGGRVVCGPARMPVPRTVPDQDAGCRPQAESELEVGSGLRRDDGSARHPMRERRPRRIILLQALVRRRMMQPRHSRKAGVFWREAV